MARRYRLGRRQAAVDRATAAILAAARDLLAAGAPPSMEQVARRAGVSRATVYHRFPNGAALLAALRPAAQAADGGEADPRQALHEALRRSSAAWAAAPGVYRHLPLDEPGDGPRALAERLAAADALRAGCSLKEAEDVIAALTSFPVFDRLHKDGRRAPAAVADILARLAAGILT